MDQGYRTDDMLELYLYETTQNIAQLEAVILRSEQVGTFASDAVDEIFRIMHTIKGSSAMMMYTGISSLTHALEDLFYVLREEKPAVVDCQVLADLILEGVDFIKVELEKIKNEDEPDGEPVALIQRVKLFLSPDANESGVCGSAEPVQPAPAQRSETLGEDLLGLDRYAVTVFFEEGCAMEHIRAYGIVCHLNDVAHGYSYYPEDILENDASAQTIREQGFKLCFYSDRTPRELHDFFSSVMFVRDIELVAQHASAGQPDGREPAATPTPGSVSQDSSKDHKADPAKADSQIFHQSIISVDVDKLDRLMELMGELVISEAMVTQNPELEGLKLDDFLKAARQLRKITGEMQDMVMSIRMVSLSATFHKMRRLVRDMGRKLDKDVQMDLIGEHTEVDKNIIEHLSDPLMHLVRNAIDHGLESTYERELAGKPPTGTVTLEALNAGNDVVVMVRDDGCGLKREMIIKKAMANGLIHPDQQDLSDREVYNLVLMPGFSTNENVTEYSGRGVGMDVVVKNLESVGGSVSLNSTEGLGTEVVLKIPLTLAIIDGMNMRVGQARYTLPTTSIRETFQARPQDLLKDPDGREMIMVRGSCYPIFRIHREFGVQADTADLKQGIFLMIEQDNKCLCLFADELIGQQQVVVKPLPAYMKNKRNVEGLAGCTLLGDGSISLILNVGGLIHSWYQA